MNFPEYIFPTRAALHNPIANLIRNNHRSEVERIFSMSRETEDKQYEGLLADRARDLWRTGIYLSNKYAEEHEELTEYE